MFKKVVFFSAALLFFCMKISFAIDLDTPVEKKITIRSEMARGAAAVFNCMRKKFFIKEIRDCIDTIVATDKQKNTDTEPFLLAVYFRGWNEIVTHLQVVTDKLIYVKLGQGYEYDMGKEFATLYFKEFKKRQRQLGLNDETVCNAVGLKYDVLKNQIDEWTEKIGKD